MSNHYTGQGRANCLSPKIGEAWNLRFHVNHFNQNLFEGVSKLKGIAQIMDNEVITMTPEAKQTLAQPSLPESVRESLKNYFTKLEGQTPANLYGMVIAEVEKPLIEMVLQLTNGNQSKAAKILGISRGTLRKKMAIYQIH